MQANATLIIANNIMESIHQRITNLISLLELNAKTFAEAIGVAPAVIYNIVGGRLNKPSFDVLQKIFIAYDIVNPIWLMTGKGEPFRKKSFYGEAPSYRNAGDPLVEKVEEEGMGKNVHPNVHLNVHLNQKDKTKRTEKEVVIKPVMVPVDHTLNEVITFVPTKVQAGYLVGYGDPEFIKELPAFGFPGFHHGTFRAFEVQGYSMLQYEGAGLYPSDIVIAAYLEDLSHIKDNRVYVVASDEGLLIKRCVNRLEANGKLICNSDNKNGDYPPIILDTHQIHEVWEFKGKFSRQIPNATKVFEEITDLQTKYTMMEADMRETNRLLQELNNKLEKGSGKE